MGIQSSIDIKLIGHIDLIHILRNLPDDLWKFDIEESIKYLPVGDTDFDWEFVPKTTLESVLNIIETKFHNSETIGLSIYNLNIKSGFLFHFFPESNTIMLLLNIYRLKIVATRFTNFSLYLSEILKIIPQHQIVSIVCEDIH